MTAGSFKISAHFQVILSGSARACCSLPAAVFAVSSPPAAFFASALSLVAAAFAVDAWGAAGPLMSDGAAFTAALSSPSLVSTGAGPADTIGVPLSSMYSDSDLPRMSSGILVPIGPTGFLSSGFPSGPTFAAPGAAGAPAAPPPVAAAFAASSFFFFAAAASSWSFFVSWFAAWFSCLTLVSYCLVC